MIKEQDKWNIGLIVFIVLFLLLLGQFNIQLALNLALGIAIGFTLEKSRFCFVAALRDPIILGITSLTQALIILEALSILGFAVIILTHPQSNLILNVFPLGIHTIFGGVLFGIGMVLAGGCASGILMRIGEGFGMQMVAFTGLLFGALLGERSQEYWQTTWGEWPGIFIPDKLGWIPAILLELAILSLLFIFARRWQTKNIGK